MNRYENKKEEQKSVTINAPVATVYVDVPKDEPKYKPGQSVKISPGCRIRIHPEK
jgi:hypothetical protein